MRIRTPFILFDHPESIISVDADQKNSSYKGAFPFIDCHYATPIAPLLEF
jgi:hypothetical protein